MRRLALILAATLMAGGSASARTFYFPHYGDGSGLSMLVSVSNFSDQTATGTIRFRDPQGAPQTLPFQGGAVSEMALSLGPNSSIVLNTDGSSNPVRSGYIEVQLDREETGGVAIFRFGSGSSVAETSVLPLELGRRFSVFVQRSDVLDTGLAAFRSVPGSPIQLRLYDLQGNLLREQEWSFQGSQTAEFLGQIFADLGDMQGVLTLESAEPFAPTGLRFGGGVLSTVPVFELPQRTEPYVLYGLDLGPYVAGGGTVPRPPQPVTEARLRELIDVFAPHVRWLRTYTCASGIDKAGKIAHEKGLKAAMGAFLSSSAATNTSEINALLAAAQAGYVDVAIVGSEVLERGDLTEAQLIGYIRQVKQALPGIPVTTADTFNQLLNHPNVLAEVDVIYVNYYPFFDPNVPLDVAVFVLNAWHNQLTAIAGGKEIIVSETGWPTCGANNGQAVPSFDNAAYYFLNFVSWARARNVNFFYFSAFDERWKGGREACFGLWDETLQLKPGMQDVFDGRTIPDNWTTAP